MQFGTEDIRFSSCKERAASVSLKGQSSHITFAAPRLPCSDIGAAFGRKSPIMRRFQTPQSLSSLVPAHGNPNYLTVPRQQPIRLSSYLALQARRHLAHSTGRMQDNVRHWNNEPWRKTDGASPEARHAQGRLHQWPGAQSAYFRRRPQAWGFCSMGKVTG